MAGPRSLHELVEDAVQRAALVQEDSHKLAERRRAVAAALDDTLRCIRDWRLRRARFGIGHRRAGTRSRAG